MKEDEKENKSGFMNNNGKYKDGIMNIIEKSEKGGFSIQMLGGLDSLKPTTNAHSVSSMPTEISNPLNSLKFPEIKPLRRLDSFKPTIETKEEDEKPKIDITKFKSG